MIFFTICGLMFVGAVFLCLRNVPKDVEDKHSARLAAKNSANSKFNYSYNKDEIRYSKDFALIAPVFKEIEVIEIKHANKTIAKEHGFADDSMPKNKPVDEIEEQLLRQRIQEEVGRKSSHGHDSDDLNEEVLEEDISAEEITSDNEGEYGDLIDVIEVKLG